ncbi:MAG: PIN domain-containing protein [Bacteroidia bacterium]
MIYLILDTNIWIYLANGFDTKSQKFHDNHHFHLLRRLMDLSEEGDICILINDLIIEEWKRNKINAEKKIALLSNKLLNNSLFTEISKYVSTSLKELKVEYNEGIKEEIKANNIHIALLEKFLFNDCQKMPLADEIKLKVFNYSTAGKAPFHNKKNNTADAAILFSVTHFFKDHYWKYGDSVMFISNNTAEFTDGINTSAFHPDILDHLGDFSVQFYNRLPEALDISAEIIKDIDSYNQNRIVQVPPTDCMMFYCGNEDLEFSDSLEVRYEIDEDYDPNQLSLFPQYIKKTRRKFVSSTNCPHCETLHFQCPRCLEINCVDDSEVDCSSCGLGLSLIENPQTGNWDLFVHNVFKPREIPIDEE